MVGDEAHLLTVQARQGGREETGRGLRVHPPQRVPRVVEPHVLRGLGERRVEGVRDRVEVLGRRPASARHHRIAWSGSSHAANGTGRFPCLRRENRSSSAAPTTRPSTTSAADGSWKIAFTPRTRMGNHYPGEALLTPPRRTASQVGGLPPSRSGQTPAMTRTTTPPRTPLTAAPQGTATDAVDAAVGRARTAAPGWRGTSPADRAALLRRPPMRCGGPPTSWATCSARRPGGWSPRHAPPRRSRRTSSTRRRSPAW